MKFGSSLCLPLLATAMSKRAERALSAVNQRLASMAQLESELKSVEFRYGQEQLLRWADETAAVLAREVSKAEAERAGRIAVPRRSGLSGLLPAERVIRWERPSACPERDRRNRAACGNLSHLLAARLLSLPPVSTGRC
jgi:hypothetical protein